MKRFPLKQLLIQSTTARSTVSMITLTCDVFVMHMHIPLTRSTLNELIARKQRFLIEVTVKNILDSGKGQLGRQRGICADRQNDIILQFTIYQEDDF